MSAGGWKAGAALALALCWTGSGCAEAPPPVLPEPEPLPDVILITVERSRLDIDHFYCIAGSSILILIIQQPQTSELVLQVVVLLFEGAYRCNSDDGLNHRSHTKLS